MKASRRRSAIGTHRCPLRPRARASGAAGTDARATRRSTFPRAEAL